MRARKNNALHGALLCALRARTPFSHWRSALSSAYNSARLAHYFASTAAASRAVTGDDVMRSAAAALLAAPLSIVWRRSGALLKRGGDSTLRQINGTRAADCIIRGIRHHSHSIATAREGDIVTTVTSQSSEWRRL